jgi:sugar O-acyltransferase (sialic acid O-acetyltransferase NeuD family)
VKARAVPCVLLGAGGHARVVLAAARAAGLVVSGVCDPVLAAEAASNWEGVDVLGDDAALERLSPYTVQLLLGIGQLTQGSLREQLFARWRERGHGFPVLIHPRAWAAPDARLAEGVQLMAGAIVQPGCAIGENTLINTAASIDHDCTVGRHVHIAPGARLCGAVHIGDGACIGAGAVVIQGVRIGAGAVVGAGVTALRDLEPARTLVGASNRLR